MVRRGLAQDRDEAVSLIHGGAVLVGGAPAVVPGRLVAPGEAVTVRSAPPRYVGRGGAKLESALHRFAIDVVGVRALDAGSSTGGFTDCLLQAGAAAVIAVDVGRGQLHQRLRVDPRVDVRERTDVRALDPGDLGDPVDLVVADLSFLSLRLVADALLRFVRPGGAMVVLVKPQFEAERAEVDAGRGVIRDPGVWRRALIDVGTALEQRGAAIMGLMVSPLRGADGNVEFLLHAVAAKPSSAATADLPGLVDVALAEVTDP